MVCKMTCDAFAIATMLGLGQTDDNPINRNTSDAKKKYQCHRNVRIQRILQNKKGLLCTVLKNISKQYYKFECALCFPIPQKSKINKKQIASPFECARRDWDSGS